MTVVPTRLATAIAGTALALGALGACAPIRGHTGYIIDAELVNSVQPGVDTRQSVQQVLGRPTFTGQFDRNADWYYLARSTKNLAFVNPKVTDQVTLRIAFTPDGTVQSVTRSDEKRVAAIDPSRKVTPTLGRKRSFFEELFGNIGSVGAPGMGTVNGPNRGDTP